MNFILRPTLKWNLSTGVSRGKAPLRQNTNHYIHFCDIVSAPDALFQLVSLSLSSIIRCHVWAILCSCMRRFADRRPIKCRIFHTAAKLEFWHISTSCNRITVPVSDDCQLRTLFWSHQNAPLTCCHNENLPVQRFFRGRPLMVQLEINL